MGLLLNIIAISLDTLRELYGSPNCNIRQASVKILVERAIRDENLGLLLRNAGSKDLQVREEAMTILAYLTENSSCSSLCMSRIYGVIVDALVSYLPESANRVHEPYTDWKLRSKTEYCALTVFLHILILRPSTMEQWLKAGLITRWLTHYPFGGIKAKNLNKKQRLQLRSKLIDEINASETDDQDLEVIFRELLSERTSVAQLRRHDLMGSFANVEDKCISLPFVKFRYQSTASPPLRRDDHDTETEEFQAARRRRRREAVVIGDAGQPISQDNIFNVDAQDMDIE